jgi:hypothetical protein
MAPRVTETEVLAILDTDREEAAITPFVTAANLVVTDRLTGAHAAALLKEIERWMAAHLASVLDSPALREKLGDAEIEYGKSVGISDAVSATGLLMTRYGKQVLLLDSSGLLASGVGKRRAVLTAIDFSLS